jgi:hypothetical protein
MPYQNHSVNDDENYQIMHQETHHYYHNHHPAHDNNKQANHDYQDPYAHMWKRIRPMRSNRYCSAPLL